MVTISINKKKLYFSSDSYSDQVCLTEHCENPCMQSHIMGRIVKSHFFWGPRSDGLTHIIGESETLCACIIKAQSTGIRYHACTIWQNQGLRASSLQFTSPLEFNAIFHDGFTQRLKLNRWSKIYDPVTAKFKHVTVIVTCTLLCCDDVTYVPVLWNFQKADLEPYPYSKKYTTFSFPVHGTLASNICLRDAPTCSCIQLYT